MMSVVVPLLATAFAQAKPPPPPKDPWAPLRQALEAQKAEAKKAEEELKQTIETNQASSLHPVARKGYGREEKGTCRSAQRNALRSRGILDLFIEVFGVRRDLKS